MPGQVWMSTGALCCAVAIVAGAFGAHGLKARLDGAALELWETAARYLMYGGFGLTILGLSSRALDRPLTGAGVVLLAGSVIFSGTVFALAVGGPRWLGAVTPIGGGLMILAFVLLAASWRS